jgi:hypothetical protein
VGSGLLELVTDIKWNELPEVQILFFLFLDYLIDNFLAFMRRTKQENTTKNGKV